MRLSGRFESSAYVVARGGELLCPPLPQLEEALIFFLVMNKTLSPLERLAAYGMRMTRPRVEIAQILFANDEDRHVTADWVADELARIGERVALATVYNTLNCFVEAGLLREVSGASNGSAIFDTNTAPHHHVLDETTGMLSDIPADAIAVTGLPDLPKGKTLIGCEVVIRIK